MGKSHKGKSRAHAALKRLHTPSHRAGAGTTPQIDLSTASVSSAAMYYGLGRHKEKPLRAPASFVPCGSTAAMEARMRHNSRAQVRRLALTRPPPTTPEGLALELGAEWVAAHRCRLSSGSEEEDGWDLDAERTAEAPSLASLAVRAVVDTIGEYAGVEGAAGALAMLDCESKTRIALLASPLPPEFYVPLLDAGTWCSVAPPWTPQDVLEDALFPTLEVDAVEDDWELADPSSSGTTLRGTPRLRRLALVKSEVHPRFFRELFARLPSLTHLALVAYLPSALRAALGYITDAGAGLAHLDLRHCTLDVSRMVLDCLRKLPRLRVLDLRQVTGTISVEYARDLAAGDALPGVTVLLDDLDATG